MADTVKEHTVQLDLAGPATDVAYDVSGRRMATCSSSSSGGTVVQIHEAGPGPGSWTQVAAWETDLAITTLSWAHPEYGQVVAGGSSTGSVLVWGQVPELQVQASLGLGGGAGAGPAGQDAAGGFAPLAELVCSSAPCRAVVFAPRQTGLVLAALADDGAVYVHESEDVIAPRAWSLHSKIKAGPAGYCRGMCWRPFTHGVPPMLCVGAGQQVGVWQYVLALNTWQLVLRLECPGQDVCSVHWAPTLGRPAELLAVGAGRDLLVYSLTGDTAALQASQLAALEHEEAVWKVEWDMWGNQVAAGTQGQQVHVYKPDLVGSWVKLAWVQGQEPSA